MSKRILFFGNERLATGVTTSAPTLRALVEAGYDVAAVVVAQKPVAKSRQGRWLEIMDVAAKHDIEVIALDNLNDSLDKLSAYQAEAAVLVAYGKIVPPALLELFPKGIVNIHPSLLPLHRGPTPIESVILGNEAETGVSLMKLAPKMDAGPVYAQQVVKLNGDENKQQLADRLADIGASLVAQNLPAILDGSLQAKGQDDSQATYDQPLSKQDGLLDFNKAAAVLEREVRAYYGWPRSRAQLGAIDVVVTKSRVIEGNGQPGSLYPSSKQLGVYTGNDILIIDKLVPPGKTEMTAEAFLAGYKLA